MLKIVLTGPESTGKTTLARQLAEHFQTIWVPEYARFYLIRLRRPYEQSDVLEIAKSQVQWEDAWAKHAKQVLFSDTALLVPKIWLQFKYKSSHDWIDAQLQTRKYSLYLLCDVDLPWGDDPLRENPNLEDRQVLFQMYETELQALGANFTVLSGTMPERLQQAIRRVNALLENSVPA